MYFIPLIGDYLPDAGVCREALLRHEEDELAEFKRLVAEMDKRQAEREPKVDYIDEDGYEIST